MRTTGTSRKYKGTKCIDCGAYSCRHKPIFCLCIHDKRDHDKKDLHKCMICSCQAFSEKRLYKNARTPCECDFCWRYKRQPRNFDIVHLIEALMDSANQLLVRENIDGAFDRIHRVIGICRELIRAEPTTNFDRCRYRNNPRMRCNLPLTDGKCTYHGENVNHDLVQNTLDDWNVHPPKYSEMEINVK